MAKIFRENSFEGGPGGSSGTLNYQTPYGTSGGGNVTQNPDKFSSSDKTVNHMNNQSTSSMVTARLPERPDRKSSSGSPIHPSNMSDKQGFENSNGPGDDPKKPNTIEFGDTTDLPDENSSTLDPDTKTKDDIDADNKPIDPTKGFDKQVDKIFTKKVTPTPDDVLSALQYEMNQMVKKDKYIAKQVVLKNMKKDPKYYSRLNNLNIDDDKMRVDESNIMNEDTKKTNIEKTKSVLDQMISERQKRKAPIKNSKEIDGIFKELWDRRHGFKNRK